MKLLNALGAGLAGAVVLTVTHQLLHKMLKEAPRMDLMGEEALKKLACKANKDIGKEQLYGITMAGDIVVNSLFYAVLGIGKPKQILLRSTLHGFAAGLGGVYLPKYFGLTNSYSDRSTTTKLITVGIYTLGGLVTGAILRKEARANQLKSEHLPTWREDISK